MGTKSILTGKAFLNGKTALVCLFVVVAVVSVPGQHWETGSFDEALTKAKASGKLLLLDFYQEFG